MGRSRSQLAIGIGLIALFGAGTIVALGAGTGRWESEVVRWAHDLDDAWAWLWWPLMQLGSAPGAVVVSLLVGYRLGRRAGLVVFTSFAAAYAVANLTKLLVERTRPDVADLGEEPRTMLDTFAFPSGHASQAFAVAVSVALVAGRFGRWRYALVPAAFATGFARMYFGVHFPGDVGAGAVLGTGIALVVEALFSSRGSAPALDLNGG